MLKVGSLFSGIGGIELGLERTGGFKTIWQCEIAEYPSAVLAERFPGIPNYGDITKVVWDEVERPDVVCGGFPCQDISIAGKGKGIIEGKRSGLWSEFARCLRTLRPRYALVENVPALADRGLWLVLADIASLGYDAEWQIISAAQCGAPHRRERLFIIAHADRSGFGAGRDNREGRPVLPPEIGQASEACPKWSGRLIRTDTRTAPDPPDANCPSAEHALRAGWKEFEVFANIRRVEDLRGRPDIPQPLLRRTDDGLSTKLDKYKWRERIKALGNAVVPACAEIAGRRIMELGADAV